MKKIWMISGALLTCTLSWAQYDVDALRYSQQTFGGTARSNGMAGAFGAIGADFSTLSTNPAGIGMYRKSELTLTPSIATSTNTSTYNGQSGTSLGLGFNFGNAGIVLTGNIHPEKPEDEGKGWISYNFGIGYNRTSDYNYGISVPNTVSNSSMVSDFINSANGKTSGNLNAFYEGLAFNNLIVSTGNTTYASLTPSGSVIQNYASQSSGGAGETVISFGGNYENRFYLGATIGIPTINYSNNSTYNEQSKKDSIPAATSFSVANNYSASGTGINVKIGAIYRIFDFLRVGLAYHSPTYYSISENYSTTLTSNYHGSAVDSTRTTYSPSGSFEYQLITPSRIIASAALVLWQRLMVDVDAEYIDYSKAYLLSNSTAGAFTNDNNAIAQNYTSTMNFRAGAEFRLLPSVALRAGLANYGNPYASSANINASRTSETLGLGIRGKSAFLDLALVNTQYSENYYLYSPTNTGLTPVKNSFNNTGFMATFGVRF